MLIHSLALQGIRTFDKPVHFHFKKGLNIIYGPNESGKTTLQEAIFHLLYTNVDTLEGEKQQSWFNEEVAEAALIYETEQGEMFRLTKDYLHKKISLEKKQKEKWSLFTAQKEQVNHLVKKHWRLMDKKVFQNTYFVQQKHLSQLDKQEIGKIRQLLGKVLFGQEKECVLQAEKQLQAIKEQVNSEIEKNGQRMTFWQDEEEKYWQAYRSEQEEKKELVHLQNELTKKESLAEELSNFWNQYEQMEKINRELVRLQKQEKLLESNLQEAEGYQDKVEQLKKELYQAEKKIGEVSVEQMENWQNALTEERKNTQGIEEEKKQEAEEIKRLEQKIEQLKEGMDDDLAGSGETSMQELNNLESVIVKEEAYLEDLKKRDKKSKQMKMMQYFLAGMCFFFGYYQVMLTNWLIGVSIATFSASWFLLVFSSKNQSAGSIKDQDDHVVQLREKKQKILSRFHCANQEELKERLKDYHALQEEISILVKEIRLKKAKIIKLEKKKKETFDKRDKLQNFLTQLFKRAGVENFSEAIALRKNYDLKIEERRDWQKKLWKKLGREKLKDWQQKWKILIEDKQYLLDKLKTYPLSYPLSLVRLQEQKQKERSLKNDLTVIREKILVKQQGIEEIKRQYKFSLNQVRGEVIYWEKENARLLEKSKVVQVSLLFLTQAMSQMERLIYPKLERAVQEVFSQINNQVGSKIELKDNLDFMIHLKENAMHASSLSLGSLEQLYLTMRIAVGKILNKEEAIPFFLDDVLVNFDRIRRLKTIQLLAKLASEQQIFLFTHDMQDAMPVYGHILDLTPTKLADCELEVG